MATRKFDYGHRIQIEFAAGGVAISTTIPSCPAGPERSTTTSDPGSSTQVFESSATSGSGGGQWSRQVDSRTTTGEEGTPLMGLALLPGLPERSGSTTAGASRSRGGESGGGGEGVTRVVLDSSVMGVKFCAFTRDCLRPRPAERKSARELLVGFWQNGFKARTLQ